MSSVTASTHVCTAPFGCTAAAYGSPRSWPKRPSLEDSAYQSLIPSEHLERDAYIDGYGNVGGNDDHLTSFDAGHGLVDAVSALALAKFGVPGARPDPCPAREAEASITDPPGDTTAVWTVPTNRASADILAITASVIAEPRAVTVEVRLADLPDADLRMILAVDGRIDGEAFEVEFDRPADAPAVYSGNVNVDATVNTGADTITFVVRRDDDATLELAAVFGVWTSTGAGQADTDATMVGTCPIWTPSS